MKRRVYRVSLALAILALAVGIFCYLWSMRTRDVSNNGTLVQNLCHNFKNCLNV